MGRRGIVSLFCLSIFIFLSLSHTKKLSEIQVGGRFGSFRKKGFLGYGVISDDLWLLGENPPLFSSGDVYDGVVNATKGSKISYFSGQFLAAKDDDYQGTEENVPGIIRCFLGQSKCDTLPSIFSAQVSTQPECHTIPSITTQDNLVAIVCGGPENILGPDITTAYLYSVVSAEWVHANLPCDTPQSQSFYCNAKLVWRIPKALFELAIEPKGEESSLRYLIFSVHFPIFDSYNLVYYTQKNGVWLWNYLFSFDATFSGASGIQSIRSVAQNNITGEMFVSGKFIRSFSLLSISYLAFSTSGDQPDWGYNFNLSSEADLQIITNSDAQGDQIPWLLIMSGNFEGVCPLDPLSSDTTLAYLSPFYNFTYVCQSSTKEEIFNELSMKSDDPLSGFVVVPSVPLLPGTYLTGFYVAYDGSFAYASIDYQDVLDSSPPYVLVYQILDNVGWMRDLGRIYPPPMTEKDLCPHDLCDVKIISPASIPFDFGSGAVFFTSVDTNFTQFVSTANSTSLLNIADPFVVLFATNLVNVGEVRFISNIQRGKNSEIVVGHFKSQNSAQSGFQNVAILQKKDSETKWVGMGKSGGVTAGAVLSVVAIKVSSSLTTIIIGGLFRYEYNGQLFLHIAQLKNCPSDNPSCSGSEWEPVNPTWTFSASSLISSLVVDGHILFIGGSFTLYPNGTETDGTSIENFAIWDLDNNVFREGSGFAENDESFGCVDELFCPPIEFMRIVNRDLWISGTFNCTEKNQTGDEIRYLSLARFDLVTQSWLPVLGFQHEINPERIVRATLSTLSFVTDSHNLHTDINGNINITLNNNNDSILVQLFVGGSFNMAEFYPTVSFPYYNFAVCCLIFSEGEFLPYGILSSYGDPVTYNRSLLPNDLPSACQESNFGFFEGRMGGVNGPVTVLAPDDSTNDIILGGAFAGTLGRRDAVSTSGCPLIRYNRQNSLWTKLPTSNEVRCLGVVLSVWVGVGDGVGKGVAVELVVLVGIGVVVLFVVGLGVGCWVLGGRRERGVVDVRKTYSPENIILFGKTLDSRSRFDEREEEKHPSTPILDYLRNGSEIQIDEISHLHPYIINILGFAEANLISVQTGKKKNISTYLYVIEVKCGVAKWTVNRSYVDFSVLNSILSQTYVAIKFPVLPLRNAEKKGDLHLMKKELQLYLRSLLDCTFEEGLSKITDQDQMFSYFLQVDCRAFLYDNQYKMIEPMEESWKINTKDIEIKRRVGFGSYSEVFKGVWKGVDVAVKVVSSTCHAENLLESFVAETTLMAKLHHRNVITLYGVSCSPPNHLLVTEWMAKGSLFDIIHSKSLRFLSMPLGFRLKLAHDVTLGVSYLHSLVPPVIHRDLKSLNLLVDGNWLVKVADFGLSKIKDFFEETSSIVGTPAWSAPEVLRGEKYDEKVDVYSFAIILWEILEGKRPLEGMKYKQVVQAVCFDGLRPPIEKGKEMPELAELLPTLWQDDRKKRPSFEQVSFSIGTIMLKLDRARPFERATRLTRKSGVSRRSQRRSVFGGEEVRSGVTMFFSGEREKEREKERGKEERGKEERGKEEREEFVDYEGGMPAVGVGIGVKREEEEEEERWNEVPTFESSESESYWNYDSSSSFSSFGDCFEEGEVEKVRNGLLKRDYSWKDR